MIAQKRLVRVTLDIECYDDLDLQKIDWKEFLALEGDEKLDVTIKEIDPFFWCDKKISIPNSWRHLFFLFNDILLQV